ncbi:MAG: family 10 glycosylhydrolase [Clostridia bacterium]
MRRITAVFLILSIILCGCGTKKKAAVPSELRGAWVASVGNLDFPSEQGLSVRKLKSETIKLLDAAHDMGLNAVFLQVRPCGDAIYPSKLYPWSKYLTGKQGTPPPDDFDPLKFWVDEAKKRGIALHAWINPLRVRTAGMTDGLDAENVAIKHPEWTVKYTDGNIYLNPGISEVRDYIVRGVREIAENYDVAGIHFDDYFYPGEDFEDSAQYEGSKLTRGDWRRENINEIIIGARDAAHDAGILFGVSPFAIWRNKDSSPQGSDTRGLETYSAHYADTRRWVKEGWLDYIAPQIYWNIGYEIADYEKILTWWCDIIRDSDVRLFIGHAGYRSLEAKPGEVWYGADEIARQLEMNKKYPEVSGSIHFRLGAYIESAELTAALKNEYIG